MFTYYNQLPKEIKEEIKFRLNIYDLVQIHQVESNDGDLWSRLYQRDFGDLKLIDDTHYQQFKLAYQLQKLIHCFGLKNTIEQLYLLQTLHLDSKGILNLPPELGQLKHLQKLDLEYNQN